mgnify:FL=1
MKKIALATVLALAATLASAVEVRLEGQDADGKNGTANQTVYELGVKQAINNTFAGDVVVKQYRTDGTNALATRTEAGLTGGTGLVGPVSGYTRVAIGEKYASGSQGYSYYSVEPGVSATFGGITTSLGWRFQDAFADGHNDTTRTWRAKLGYDLTKSDTVYVGYDRQRGDSEQNITKIGLVHRF